MAKRRIFLKYVETFIDFKEHNKYNYNNIFRNYFYGGGWV